MRIGLLLVCTGKYDIFLQPLIDSADKYFFRHDTVTIYLFTDKHPLLIHSDRINVIIVPTEHKPFPFCTLYRYKYFTKATPIIDADYLFYCDVDMRFVSETGREILGDIVCVQHPGFYKGGWGSENCDGKSNAYLEKKYRNDYKAGGFQGGKKEKYLSACAVMSNLITDDESRGIMAEWHDETFWNWYLKTMAENVKILDPSYCYPESWKLPFSKKILALNKNHVEIRK
mgnify:FL=1